MGYPGLCQEEFRGRDPGYITRLKVEGVTPNCFWKAAEKWLALA